MNKLTSTNSTAISPIKFLYLERPTTVAVHIKTAFAYQGISTFDLQSLKYANEKINYMLII